MRRPACRPRPRPWPGSSSSPRPNWRRRSTSGSASPMPTETDAMLTRRHCLALGAATLAAPAWSAPAAMPRLLAAWQCAPQDTAEAARYQIGLLAAQADALVVARALDVPTRAHGLLAEAG